MIKKQQSLLKLKLGGITIVNSVEGRLPPPPPSITVIQLLSLSLSQEISQHGVSSSSPQLNIQLRTD